MRGHSEASLFKLLFSSRGHRRHFFASPLFCAAHPFLHFSPFNTILSFLKLLFNGSI